MSWFEKLKSGLAKTRGNIVEKISAVIPAKKKIDEELLCDLEEALITADLGVKTSEDLIENIRKRTGGADEKDATAIKKMLKEAMLEILRPAQVPLRIGDQRPFVVLMVGVNGCGKTTTMAKIAHLLKKDEYSVLMVAADTFRAAAIEQLVVWGQRAGVEVIRQNPGADPSAVLFDALDAARARGADVVLVDTAGRLHTKVNLMEELKKIARVAAKKVAGAPHEVLLVLDANTGQNAIAQARMFNEALGVTGIALTKLDGTAKGGVIVAVTRETGIPIRYIGIGEGLDDLQEFRAEEFAEALLPD